MNTLFTVFYVLTVITAQADGAHSTMGVETSKENCYRTAQRFVASQPANTVKWACHELNITVDKDSYVHVEFPNY